MKGSSFPPGTPAWLLRHPLLLAEWLAARNLLGRARTHAVVVVAAGAAILAAAAVLGLRPGKPVGGRGILDLAVPR